MQQDWVLGLIGGLLIGGAGALYLLLNGRIMGASGIIGQLIDGTGRDTAKERVAFLVGLIGLPVVVAMFTKLPETNASDNLLLIAIAGICVGLGTRLGGGCTSGHGVCGMSRFSVRSIVVTVIYIGTGIAAFAALRLAGGVS